MAKNTQIIVVELDKADNKPLGSEKELRTAILSLQNHLGFTELLRRMRVTKALLRSRLETDSEDDNRHAIRALIQAYAFLERQLKQEVSRPEEKSREAFEEERQEYERLQQFVELVGRAN